MRSCPVAGTHFAFRKRNARCDNIGFLDMNIAQINADNVDIDLPNAKLAYTIIQSLLDGHEALSDLLVVMSHALDEDTLKALTNTGEWEKYLESKRQIAVAHVQIEKFVEVLKTLEEGDQNA
jgi:hypothetical protein